MTTGILKGLDIERFDINLADNQLFYATDTQVLYIGDGVTEGGVILPEETRDAIAALVYSSFWGGGSNNSTSSASFKINDLSDVYLTTAERGQVIQYDGYNWTNLRVVTSVSSDPTPTLIGDLNLQSNNIIGSGSVLITGNVNATEFIGTFRGDIVSDNDEFIIDTYEKTGNFTALTSNQITVNAVDSTFATFKGVTTSGTDATWIKLQACRNSQKSPESLKNGDYISGLLIQGHNGETYRTAAGIGAKVDGEYTDGGHIPSSVVIMTVDVNNHSNFLEFNSNGKLTVKTVSATVAIQQPVYQTSSERDAAISAPSAGMMVFVSDVAKFQGWNGNEWVNLS